MTAPVQPVLFDVPEEMWVRRRCLVCGCALCVTHSHTYLVQRQDWIKVGATSDPRRRLNELARPAWSQHLLSPPEMDWHAPLTTLLVLETDVEHQLHQRFRDLHVVGEWFRDDEALRHWIATEGAA